MGGGGPSRFKFLPGVGLGGGVKFLIYFVGGGGGGGPGGPYSMHTYILCSPLASIW